MLRGYRGILVALAGIALSGAQPPAKEAQRSEGAAQAAPAPKIVATPSPTPTTEPTPRFTAYPGYNPDPCYQSEDHDAADLCAQWRAAIAAEKAAHEARRATDWSIVATFLSVVSLIAVAWALGLTVQSNKIANAALELERRSVAEANRPWVVTQIVNDGRIEEGEFAGGIYFQINLTNSGHRPAVRLYVRLDVAQSDSEGACPVFEDHPVEDHHGLVAPGGVTKTAQRPITLQQVEAWKANTVFLWLKMTARYGEPGVAGRPYGTNIIYRLDYQGMVLDPLGKPVPNFGASMIGSDNALA